MKRLNILMLILIIGLNSLQAQIGYQIALLNTATGEARANETVSVGVKLSNSEGKVFYSETKSATTNDFGVLSLTIGNSDTFNNVDFSKLPFYIEVTANGVMIGKSQILSVPVAEVAKRIAPIDPSIIIGTWESIGLPYPGYDGIDHRCYVFYSDGTGNFYWGKNKDREESFIYEIEGSSIYIFMPHAPTAWVFEGIYELRYRNGCIYDISNGYLHKKVIDSK